MKKIDIKGKDYIPVNERIIYFRTEEEYKGWSFLTEIVSIEEGIVLMNTTVYDEKGVPKSNGFASEKDGSSFINKTSYIENCETSSVGRALGNLGIGVDTSVASFEEVANAITQQNKPTTKPQPKPKKEYSNNDDMVAEGIRKGIAMLEKLFDKAGNDSGVIKSQFLKKHNWNSMKDILFKDNLEFKILMAEIKELVDTNEEMKEVGI